jgi:hypothetical protein
MPYELSFTKALTIADPKRYINECCSGGDQVIQGLLSAVPVYDDLQSGQEDWGWYIWFHIAKQKYEINVFCDDPGLGSFRIHLVSKAKSGIFSHKIEDSSELEPLKQRVVANLEAWGAVVQSTLLDANFAPA